MSGVDGGRPVTDDAGAVRSGVASVGRCNRLPSFRFSAFVSGMVVAWRSRGHSAGLSARGMAPNPFPGVAQ